MQTLKSHLLRFVVKMLVPVALAAPPISCAQRTANQLILVNASGDFCLPQTEEYRRHTIYAGYAMQAELSKDKLRVMYESGRLPGKLADEISQVWICQKPVDLAGLAAGNGGAIPDGEEVLSFGPERLKLMWTAGRGKVKAPKGECGTGEIVFDATGISPAARRGLSDGSLVLIASFRRTPFDNSILVVK